MRFVAPVFCFTLKMHVHGIYYMEGKKGDLLFLAKILPVLPNCLTLLLKPKLIIDDNDYIS